MTAGDEAAFASLAQRIAESAGLTLEAYKTKCIKRRIAVRMRACGVHTYVEYLAVLDRTPKEMDRLLDALTINVTKFFRNPETWGRVRDLVLPGLLAPGQGPIRIWSAGCSSGEEAYTLAMILADALSSVGRAHELSRVTIDATDIDRVSLEKARAASYPEAALDDAPPGLVSRYGKRDAAGNITVADEVRRLVRVTRHDVTSEPPLNAPYQLIVCRNVVIYFDRPTQERLMTVFYDALAPGGVLVLGKVETIFGPSRSRLELVEPRERIYRRPA
ncbi:MAG TPA: protein-glutamate O-methyltransferase CheR [Gemmatimonadales bacterium]|jgi:chemotaxis methyl-accepting protein methylase|nr:protein-glutamate O-methyltransferase CheR [Gemmatimonadales bacterium]